MEIHGWEPDPYAMALTGAGLLIALVAWLPLALRRLPLSLPIVCLAIGGLIYTSPYVTLDPSPGAYPYATERLTEFVVLVALMGAGLKIDRRFSFRGWGTTGRLLLITMPMSIIAIAFIGTTLLGLGAVAALLLAASLAPTDPVLAADIQVAGPQEGGEDTVRFALTSEAGLNDGFAFPFVHLAIVLSLAATTGEPWFARWLTLNVLWETIAGICCGWLVGRVFGWVTFRMPGDTLAKTGDGLVAIAATFVSYGVSELLHCYGFFAVFVTALTLRNSHRDHDFQRDMHDITEQIERIAMMLLLLAFGGAIVNGLLSNVGWTEIVAVVLILLVVRPVTGLLALIGVRATLTEKITIAFFGIRGVGSFYYLAYGLNHGQFEGGDRLWVILSLVVFVSILMHGLTVTPAMRWLDRRHGREAD
ncbi:cation:proton antiporter [Neorhizobium galegae]|uniref:cation:proton antiporter n=1 Tax=Neorhizobium galegae TaxID=399 RepID=UPI0006211BE2|nr:cation:proton antiporter [Neorhizobium galegae]MCQ1775933.1 cation:proton antiporter [Neorhizobium galegae]MCQ1797891.1 cation:proton antiporter [Neorhizobium galegae]CDZ29913.1 Sodium/hydrogen exchanger [Neorhizobium galegae bv. officinalis]